MWFLKILLTVWVIVLVPVYWHYYGLQNFLWISDIGLFATVIALWMEWRLLMNVITLITLPVELVWNIVFFVELFSGYSLIGMAHYMFEAQYPLFLRGLSLFHVILPPLWIWCIMRWGYDKRALLYGVILSWIIAFLTYFLTKPEANINWVFSPQIYNWQSISNPWWVILFMIIITILYVALHHILLYATNQKSFW